eukprot:m.93249 g.93249  ORF g.93249 m.93249 type:complete len:73 (+) comp12121_c0_seq2:1505-1723(+)
MLCWITRHEHPFTLFAPSVGPQSGQPLQARDDFASVNEFASITQAPNDSFAGGTPTFSVLAISRLADPVRSS